MTKLDQFTSSLILGESWQDASGGHDASANLYKALNKNLSSLTTLQKVHDNLWQLWYTPWSFVSHKITGWLGKIASYNISQWWLYDGVRYPINVAWPSGDIFPQSVFLTQYEDFASLHWNPTDFLVYHHKDLWRKSVEWDEKQLQQNMDIQNRLQQMNVLEIISYMNEYLSTQTEQNSYNKEFGQFILRRQWQEFLNNMDNIIAFVDIDNYKRVVTNKELHTILHWQFTERLAYYSSVYWYLVPHGEVFRIYRHVRNRSYKNAIKDILCKRAEKMDDNELYTFATMTKWSDLYNDVLSILEGRIAE